MHYLDWSQNINKFTLLQLFSQELNLNQKPKVSKHFKWLKNVKLCACVSIFYMVYNICKSAVSCDIVDTWQTTYNEDPALSVKLSTLYKGHMAKRMT